MSVENGDSLKGCQQIMIPAAGTCCERQCCLRYFPVYERNNVVDGFVNPNGIRAAELSRNVDPRIECDEDAAEKADGKNLLWRGLRDEFRNWVIENAA
jgi:hypothetical protein